MAYRIERLDKIIESKDIDAFLFTSSISIKYLCGYFYNFEIGSSPFHFIPAALFVVPSKITSLVIADNETDQLAGLDARVSIKQYASYVYDKPLDFLSQFLIRIHELIKDTGMRKARIGIEANSLPHSLAESLLSAFPEIKFIDISDDLVLLRMIKDSEELALINAAAHLCDIGQEAVFKYAKPGMTELELFTLVRGDMDAVAGKRVPMMADMVCGARTFEGGGNPSDKKKETLELGISVVKPGIRASAIDQLMREHLSSTGGYKHHSGHGVGLAYHEEPRIVPYNDTELVPNMVIALEPAIYQNGYGIRLEHLVVVTLEGCKILSEFKHRFERE
ncbi:MAG: Xaa-Pro peptidase family protein [Bacteroidia bacterium]|nr:Xaa-Pro peptidase family protein [Bacteroidia bacterium]